MYSIQVYHQLNDQVLSEILYLQQRIFGTPYSKQKIREKVEGKQHFLSIHAYLDSQVVGFKTGYEISSNSFYSWVGGVDPAHRRQGIAQILMREQHEQIKALGFSKVETKSQNKFREMMITNLKAGFEITHTFFETDGGLQIVFEKRLN